MSPSLRGALATKQSNLTQTGLLRFARNDVLRQFELFEELQIVFKEQP